MVTRANLPKHNADISSLIGAKESNNKNLKMNLWVYGQNIIGEAIWRTPSHPLTVALKDPSSNKSTLNK